MGAVVGRHGHTRARRGVPSPQQRSPLDLINVDGVGARANEPRQALHGRLVLQALTAAAWHARRVAVRRPVLLHSRQHHKSENN